MNMINIADTEGICPPLEYSNRFEDGAEGQAPLSDMTFPQSQLGANVLGELPLELGFRTAGHNPKQHA